MTPFDLQGRTILITRPEPGASESAQRVRAANGIPLLAPALVVRPVEDLRPFMAAMADLDRFDGVVLTSANGARVFADAMPADQEPPPLFAVGKKTARVLEERGWRVTVPAQPEGGEILAKEILTWHPEGEFFLFPRAEEGREELVNELTKHGKKIEVVPVYRAVPVEMLADEVVANWRKIDAALFFSPKTVTAFLAAMGEVAFAPGTVLAALSPLTARALREHGLEPAVIAPRPDTDGILQGLAEFWSGAADP
ncbi:MAG: uroporphyrinogen-III synthase [Magnetococcales bacterium]|nr:uroporphyrinogen-III synthase [Magnetococcales bacterium]